jgi:succinate-semialdehyde dehydrogenase/glutarate-semialdehyde dehydrogenase
MELGGKDPAIVCADADLERAANGVVWGAFANCGQICASVERALVHRSIYDRFVDMVVERTKRLRQGPPEKGEVDVGAMTDPGQLEIVVRQVEAARQGGAKILTGGVRPEGPGQFYPPTVISTEDDTLDVVRDESFGPLLPILPFDNEEEAIRRANDSPYGLVASVWTKDVERGRKIARRLVTGTVIINDVLYTHAIAELPWFGAKHSGMGVVHSDDGLLALTRTVHVNYGMISLGNREPSWYPYTEKTTKFLKNTLQAAATAKLRHLAKVARGFLG